MAKQTILWTALPNGVRQDGRFKLSVLVSPRLNSGGDKLKDFKDFLQWTSTDISFDIEFQGHPAMKADISQPDPRMPKLWGHLFTPTTSVDAYVFDKSKVTQRKIRSYQVDHILDFIKDKYAQVLASSSEDFAALDQLGQSLSEVSELGHRKKRKKLASDLDGQLAEKRARPPSTQPNPALDFFELRRFYDRAKPASSVPAKKPKLDFHTLLASLGEHPFLLRKLGLVFDLEFTPDFPLPNPTEIMVRVIPSWTSKEGAGNTDKTPWTWCLAGQGLFQGLPRKNDPELDGGYLKLDEQGYHVLQVDIDGAAFKTMNFADTLVQILKKKTEDTPEEYSLPSLRSGGLAVAKTGRAFKLVLQQNAAKLKNTALGKNLKVDLFAEDITRGYRIDVFDEAAGKWFSLCRRKASYEFPGVEPLENQEEGWIQTALTGELVPPKDLYCSEPLFTWDGWSLCARRPGKIVGVQDEVAENSNDKDSPFDLKTILTPIPGSLPRLRYGHNYRVRARAVDLAGNSVPHDDSGDAHATPPGPYFRFEPVPPPVTLFRKPRTPGEHVERLVIRDENPLTASAERHIAPPKSSVETAELHERFDIDSGVDPSAYGLIIARENATFSDTGTPDPLNPGDFFHDSDSVDVPYLPDPLAKGVAFRNLPGMTPGNVLPVPTDAAWPASKSFRIQLTEGQGPPIPPTDATRVLQVRLPKAEVVVARMSCYVDDDGAAKFGQFPWVAEKGYGTDADVAGLRSKAADGKVWMITPYREITFVNAVRRPLLHPEFANLQVSRTAGATFAELRDLMMQVHRKSTEKLDLLAEWDDAIDDLANDGPTFPKFVNQPVFPVPIEEREGPNTWELFGKHEFRDTRYREVAYRAVGTTRFAEYFAQIKDVVLSSDVTLDPAGIVVDSDLVTSKNGAQTYARDVDYVINYETGVLSKKPGSTMPNDVRVRFIANPITRTSQALVTKDVPSSARPAAPEIVYVVPIFKWTDTQTSSGIHRLREGNALRVYMKRPWFSSGKGELLGVVMWDPTQRGLGIPEPPDAAKPFVTRWGVDPLWVAPPTDPLPTPTAFPMATTSDDALTIEELLSVNDVPFRVQVAGHAPQYDVDRKLWFCDIQIDSGDSYMPFVRLALARYQPKSIVDAELSRVIQAEYAQLTPDRGVSVAPSPLSGGTFNVSVAGAGYSKSWTSEKTTDATDGPSMMRVSVEEPLPGVEGDLGWRPVKDSDVTLTAETGRGSGYVWSGQVATPTPGGKYRLVFREYEQYPRLTAGPILADLRPVFVATVEVQASAATPSPTPTPSPSPSPTRGG